MMENASLRIHSARKLKRGAIIAIAASISFAGLLVLVLIPREPTYKGKSLSMWLDILSYDSSEKTWNEVREALTKMGADAAPYLYENITFKPSRFEMKLRKAFEAHGWFERAFPDRRQLFIPSLHALEILGTNAPVVVPAFVNSFDETRPWNLFALLSMVLRLSPLSSNFAPTRTSS